MKLDPEATLAVMLSEGTLAGPYRRTHPVTLTTRARFVRWLRNLWSK